MNTHPADCGETFGHFPHIFKTERGKVKACDGSIKKRPLPSKPSQENKNG